jgi:glycosyltransferase involved in cell wall biosynthesis
VKNKNSPTAGSRRVLYLSGALRVSTRSDGPTPGPKSHIDGVVGAFRELGFDVQTLIAGDTRVARRFFQGTGTETAGSGSKGLVRDLIRLAWRYAFALRAFVVAPSEPFILYERYGLMQSGGLFLKQRAAVSILECNGIFFREAAEDRNNLTFRKLAKRLELRAYSKADLVVVVSSELKAQLLAYAPGLANKIVVVPNGVDTNKFSKRSIEKASSAKEPFTIGWVGTLVEWQGVYELIEAIDRVGPVEGIRSKVVIVGDGPDLPRCRELAHKLGVDSEFLGFVPPDEVPSVVADFDVAYAGHLPLATGAPMYHSPLKLYEYAAMGVPTIASDSTDARALLGNAGLEKLIFSSSDRSSLDAALIEARTIPANDPRRKSLSDFVAEKASWRSRISGVLSEVDTRKRASND